MFLVSIFQTLMNVKTIRQTTVSSVVSIYRLRSSVTVAMDTSSTPMVVAAMVRNFLDRAYNISCLFSSCLYAKVFNRGGKFSKM